MKVLFTAMLLASFSPAFCTAQESDVAPPTEKIDLMKNGLRGWDWYTTRPDSRIEHVFSYEDGILKCKGRPGGYIQTKMWYRDYVLELEWRWPAEGGNNGVLVHTSAPKVLSIWPKSLEVQLGSENAGDFWTIGKTVKLSVPDQEKRQQDRRILNLSDGDEKPVGEWNKMKIICKGDTIQVFVNGKKVNEAEKLSITEGAISLQSEGTPIEFRNVQLSPLP